MGNLGGSIAKVIDNLKKGGVVIIPTDTIYGFSCLPEIKFARARIRSLKGREDKPFLILDTSLQRIKKYFSPKVTPFLDLLCTENIWPGNFTLIASKNETIPDDLVSGHNTVAVRYTNDSFIKKITDNLDSGILSTSVNFSGQKNLLKIDEIEKAFGKKVDYYYIDPKKQGKEASIICSLVIEKKMLSITRTGSKLSLDQLYSFSKKYGYILENIGS